MEAVQPYTTLTLLVRVRNAAGELANTTPSAALRLPPGHPSGGAGYATIALPTPTASSAGTYTVEAGAGYMLPGYERYTIAFTGSGALSVHRTLDFRVLPTPFPAP